MGLDMIRKASRNAACAAAAVAGATANAAYDVDILPPASPIAQQIYDLHWAIMWVCVVIFVVVFGAMFYSILKHRKSVGAKAAHFHENTTIEVIWTIIPFLILVGMAYPATKTVLDMKDASNPDLTIKVTAYQWAWEYDYLQDGVKFNSLLSTPRAQIEEWHRKGTDKNPDYLLEVDNPMVVPAGKKVRLLVTANDVIHGWYVPQLGVNQYGIPGFVKDTWFKADKPGVYRGQCSQICGKEHGFMPIVVVAKAPEEYAAWVKEHLGPDVPMHFTAFHPDYRMLDREPTPPATLTRARRIAMDNGVRYAYTGNVRDLEGGSTRCPGCAEYVIPRDGYVLGEYRLDDSGHCTAWLTDNGLPNTIRVLAYSSASSNTAMADPTTPHAMP